MTAYDAATNEFNAEQFRFHHPSEHTVNGKYYDIEMQVYHDAKEFNDTAKIKYGAVSVFFSVKNYDLSVSTAENDTVKDFFKNLKFDDLGDPVVDLISFGELMNIVKFDQRWVYKGSQTQPPCDQFVYWNVIRRVLPITPEQLALFKTKLESKEATLGAKTNNRALQPIKGHNIRYIGAHKLFLATTATLASVLYLLQ